MFKTTFNSEAKEWQGSNEESAYRNETSLSTLILDSLRKNGSKIAQICVSTHRVHTFQDLHDLTICVAKNLQKLKLKRGDLINFITSDCFQMTPIVFAALCNGITVAPIAVDFSISRLLLILEQSEPAIIICDSNIYYSMQEYLCHPKYNGKIFTFEHQFKGTRSVDELFQSNDDFDFQ